MLSPEGELARKIEKGAEIQRERHLAPAVMPFTYPLHQNMATTGMFSTSPLLPGTVFSMSERVGLFPPVPFGEKLWEASPYVPK